MDIWLKTFWTFLTLALIWNIGRSSATFHLFLFEDEQIFSDCDDKQDVEGVDKIFDLSNLNVEIGEDSVSLEGTIGVVWNVDPNDRIDMRADLLKSARGSWQPTIFSLVQKDLCNGLFEENTLWYNTWGQFVEESDRKCINNNGLVYHHVPFNVELGFDIEGEKISGLHKAVLDFEAYNGDELKSHVCIQILLDVIQK